ncbi:LOW QUALITY PROTEIN: perlucin c protein [Plakobranchus ocellatus]|uniref:Perlucin c protein n=1 Tax=Plakobranchus ocellatus TaxID=259542 RepID=A0AAV4BUK3_9GAST|nr:LOW QUALITY PROTEIN: perlucin c protein [Plakobranchus ocellatus]
MKKALKSHEDLHLVNIYNTGKAPAIHLDVSHTIDPTTESGLLVVNCSVDTRLTDMINVTSLTVFGPKPYGKQGEFNELAVVIWSSAPKLTSDLGNARVEISGKIVPHKDGHSYLFMSWDSPTPGYRQDYRCVANGLDRLRQAASIARTVKVGILKTGCCLKIDSIDLQIKNLYSKVEALGSKLDSQIKNLYSKVETLSSKLESFQQNQIIRFKMVRIDQGRFDVSGISKGRMYLASYPKERFVLEVNNRECKSAGGYLVELDDDEEYQFVYDFVTRIRGSNTFWTGGNDIEKEGHFVYFNSKKPVPPLTVWWPGQPDNTANEEHCMEIRLSVGGLNDWGCHQVGKFVCEVEL